MRKNEEENGKLPFGKEFNIMKTALQLYSIREICKDDFLGTLEKVAKAGYQGVEFAGFYDKNPEEIRAAMDKCGLEGAGAHIGIDDLEGDCFEKTLKTAKILGLQSIVVPYAGSDSEEGWIAIAHRLEEIGKKLKKEGIIFGYHNHTHELATKYNGKTVMEILLENTDPENVIWEMDACWATKGGSDPVECAKKYENRMPLIHAKDIGKDGEDTEAGAGSVNFDGIADVLGDRLKWFIVEQEKFDMDMLESIKISAANMNTICKKH